MNIMNIDLTPLFQAVIALLAALITARLIPWIKSKTNANQQESLITAARIAVLAAEQVFGSGQGREKLRYALDALKKAGFNLDETIAAEAIEKAVRDLNLFKQIPISAQEDMNTHPPEPAQEESGAGGDFSDQGGDNLDPIFAQAAAHVVSTQQGSTSMIQRRFSIGYNRAGRLMDQLEKAGIVGAAQGSKPREVLIQDANSLEILLNKLRSGEV